MADFQPWELKLGDQMTNSQSDSTFEEAPGLRPRGQLRAFEALVVVSTPFFLVALFAIALMGTSQGREISRMLTDSEKRDLAANYYVWLLSAITLWSVCLWNWSRIRVDRLAPDWRSKVEKPLAADRFNRKLGYWLIAVVPRILGSAPFLIMFLALIKDGHSGNILVANAAVMLAGFVFSLGVYSYRKTWLQNLFLARTVLSSAVTVIFVLPILTITATLVGWLNVPWTVGVGGLLVGAALNFAMSRFKRHFATWSTEAESGAKTPTETRILPLNHLAGHLNIGPFNAYFIVFQLIAISALGVVVFGAFPVVSGQTVGAATVVAYAFAAMLPVLSIIGIYCRLAGAPMVLILAVLVSISGLSQSFLARNLCCDALSFLCHRHAVRKYEADAGRYPLYAYNERKDLGALVVETEEGLASNEQADNYLNDWLKNVEGASADAPIPMIFISSSGGGQKAAFWTSRVLGEIQSRHPNFNEHIFGISTVSGGALGVATYVALLFEDSQSADHSCDNQPVNDEPDEFCRRYAGSAQQVLLSDGLSPTFAGLFFGDMFNNALPIAFLPDRATALEKSWERGWRTREGASYRKAGSAQGGRCSLDDLFGQNFLCLWNENGSTDRNKQWRPAVVINGTHVQDGVRVLTSNIDLNDMYDDPLDPKVHDFYQLFEHDIRLSTAVHNSARFPLVSPAGLLVKSKSDVRGQIVDGGYIDNYGSETIFELSKHVLAQLVTPKGESNLTSYSNEKLSNRKFLPVFIEIANDEVVDCRGEACNADVGPETRQHSAPNISFWNELFTPAAALIATGKEFDAAPKRLLKFVEAYETTLDNVSNDKELWNRARSVVNRPIYLQFRLCQVREFDTPLGWAQSQSSLGVYVGSLNESGSNSDDSCQKANARALEKMKYCVLDVQSRPEGFDCFESAN